ncbi:MAG: respiratory nitrate reductase subunit gamma [Actinobacteria bacterium]|nr:respiratory nitrate reductase subunit gamma [Actinomycetota bacterium]
MNEEFKMLVWGALPYAVIAVFVVGHVWRYRTAQYSWTTRSSQLLERKTLMVGVLLFHFGMLAVVGGHIGGLLIPKDLTGSLGITEHMYHNVAVAMGTLAGVTMTAGLVILALRRSGNERVRKASQTADFVVIVALLAVVVTGMINTIGIQLLGDSHDYRETVSPWFRGIFLLQPDPELMAEAPWSFKLHALAAMGLFALWPFTRLVHAWSVPLTFIVRPPIVFRRRDSVAR